MSSPAHRSPQVGHEQPDSRRRVQFNSVLHESASGKTGPAIQTLSPVQMRTNVYSGPFPLAGVHGLRSSRTSSSSISMPLAISTSA